MKYCMSGRQPQSVLRRADQIKMLYQDRERLIDYIEDLADKTFILEIPKDITEEDIDWELYTAYAEKVDFMFCIQNLNLAKACHAHGIRFYWSYPVFNWYELKDLIKLEPCYIIVTAPISFNLKKISRCTNIPLRMCPNLAYDAYIPREHGLYGSWIRPEDIDTYGQYIEVCDFMASTLDEEATLLHIYNENKQWPGNLNLLLKNFNINVDNRSILSEVGQIRMNCGQRCMEGNGCDLCELAIRFADALRKEHYKRNKVTPIASSEEN